MTNWTDPIPTVDMEALAEEFQLMTPEEREARLAAAKEALKPLGEALLEAQREKKQAELRLDAAQKSVNNLIEQIRHIWMPFIQGMTSADLKLDNGLKFSMKETLNVSVEDKQAAIAWFEANGLQDVMKWDIHHGTLTSIAKEKYQDPNTQIEIPGLKYSTFPIIKVK